MPRYFRRLLIAAIVAQFIGVDEASSQVRNEARDYLNTALNIIQSSALMRNSVDWTAVRSKAAALAANAKTPVQTYPAIRYTLSQLYQNSKKRSLFKSGVKV